MAARSVAGPETWIGWTQENPPCLPHSLREGREARSPKRLSSSACLSAYLSLFSENASRCDLGPLLWNCSLSALSFSVRVKSPLRSSRNAMARVLCFFKHPKPQGLGTASTSFCEDQEGNRCPSWGVIWRMVHGLWESWLRAWFPWMVVLGVGFGVEKNSTEISGRDA